ncbi:uncharacterized protein LOC113281760 [Papaver somniferum]|nr:uncharacterized protein LOC113281760 [Papaver somniferum]XP_026386374.1 uncharacterized protein LOC113281760 [Papaver somniferum]XP_026386375.1 uncharacterized protein LOC113281760 [Papaver somniferum]XP_026386376.1 uncharacterized protein LOC113281760 [Papaver somniferum]XP_026386377.1 uncharacterized protein LOC113281760 [Papaver somniferum]XP_026386379.1 uncharacterized protein LOC113281760 [Papaver somniferum]XP_026386380.1 uncharacterized protein LOC113281760 [Papaver somniferum]XP_0
MCSPLQREVIFVRGAFHWKGMRLPSETSCIVSFGIHEENFNEVVVVPQIFDDYANNAPMRLGVLGGCLCIIRSYAGVNIDVWVMKDYNVIESWTKLFVFQIPKHIMRIDDVKIIWEFKNGEVLFITTKRTFATCMLCCLVLYDPVSQICKVTKIWHQPGSHWNIEAYVERSLVPFKLNSTNDNLKLNSKNMLHTTRSRNLEPSFNSFLKELAHIILQKLAQVAPTSISKFAVPLLPRLRTPDVHSTNENLKLNSKNSFLKELALIILQKLAQVAPPSISKFAVSMVRRLRTPEVGLLLRPQI